MACGSFMTANDSEDLLKVQVLLPFDVLMIVNCF